MDEHDQPIQRIKAACLRLLARREHSRQELLEKLMQRGFEPDVCQVVIEALNEQGWQSDCRYAESYARQRIQKGYGPLRIIFELQQRGVRDIDLNTLICDLAGSWEAHLEQVYLNKYPDDKRLSGKQWAKRSRFLQQRGFSGVMIQCLYTRLGIELER